MKKGRVITLLAVISICIAMSYTYSRYKVTFNELIVLNVREPEYTIIFNSNTGTGTMQNEVFTYGTGKAINKNTFVKDGYNFVKWNTSEDGTGIDYQDEQVLTTLTTEDGKQIDLYAIWVPAGYTIEYHGLSDTTGLPTSLEVGNPLSVNFGSNNLIISSITMGGSPVTSDNYTFENNVLTIQNVTGNISISVQEAADIEYIVNNDDPSPTYSTNIPSAGYAITEYLTKTFEGLNNGNKTINKIVVVIGFENTTGAKKTTDIVLKDLASGTEYIQTAKWDKNTKVTLTYSNLSILPTGTFSIYAANNSQSNDKVKIYTQDITIYYSN